MSAAEASFVLQGSAGGWTLGRFPALDRLPGVIHAVTTRRGPLFAPASDAPETIMATWELADRLGLPGIAWARQVHGGTVLEIRDAGPAGDADGLVTGAAGLGLVVRGADCPLVLVAGPAGAGGRDGRMVVGVAHASWRSTVAGITGRTVGMMVDTLGLRASEAWAAICPSAGPCCYEVGPEVRRAALAGLGPEAAALFVETADRWRLDLWRAAEVQLVAAGLRPERILRAGICTICGGDLFPSHRREGAAASRFAAVIAIP